MLAQPQSFRPARSRGLLLALLLVPLVIALAGTPKEVTAQYPSLFQLSNLVGPTSESLLHGNGLTACAVTMTAPENPICFRAGRMPMASVVIASGIRIFGDRQLPVDIYKTVLFLIPIELCILLAWYRMPAAPGRRLAIALLLLCPFAMLPFLADVLNMQVEEGYLYSWLAFAMAILFFTFALDLSPKKQLIRALTFGLAIDAVYLSKSSMIVVVFVLAVAFLVREKHFAPRLLLLLLALDAPIGWAAHQHHAAGRYTLGTSVDGLNLFKGNNDKFLSRYPPRSGHTLDDDEPEFFHGHIFTDEWNYNDYFQHAAVAYIRAHPAATLRALLPKFEIIFFSVHKVGASQETGLHEKAEVFGIVLFRIVLWIALAGAVVGLIRGSIWAPSAAIFLVVVAAAILPYLLGFAYTRHVTILIYPAALFCSLMLLDETTVAGAYNEDLRNSRHRNDSA